MLISQIQRSGDALLNELSTDIRRSTPIPRRLTSAIPRRVTRPEQEPGAGPDDWLEMLHERWIGRRFEGLGRRTEIGQAIPAFSSCSRRRSSTNLPRCCAERPPGTARHVSDRYFTAFSDAWLDYQGLREQPGVLHPQRLLRGPGAKVVVASFSDYPERALERHVIATRARGMRPRAAERGLRRPGQGAGALEPRREETLAAKAKRSDAVFVVAYEDLVVEPERETRP